MPTNNVRKTSYNVDNNSDNKDNFKGVALTNGNSEYAKFFFCFFVSFFFFVFFFLSIKIMKRLMITLPFPNI